MSRLDDLDAAQRAVVLADEPATLVRAQVGSGKTTVLVHKVLHLHLACGVPLDEIAVLTFTVKAAEELRARLGHRAWLVGTFHGVALALLERALPIERRGFARGLTVLDEDASDALVADVIRAHRLRVRGKRRIRERLAARARGVVDARDGDALARLATLLEAEKRARNAMDFDDLIAHAVALLGEVAGPRPRWILVDELQDCDPAQLELVLRLRGPDTRVLAVGDPVQAIYGWRGGRPDVFTRLERALGARVRELPTSYRSTRTILDGARAVLGRQPFDVGTLVGARGGGPRIVVRRHHDPVAEGSYLAARIGALTAEGVPARQIAILCRLRAQCEELRRHLDAQGVASVDDADADVDAVRVMTLHAAKGLELAHVFIAGANLGVLPLETRDEIADDAEERRLLYVGITRARDGVEISYPARPHQFGAIGAPCPFLHLLPADTVEWTEPSAPPAVVAPRPAPAPTSRWTPGARVRHARYGTGTIVAVTGDAIECDFGKLGPRSFPAALCPLTVTP